MPYMDANADSASLTFITQAMSSHDITTAVGVEPDLAINAGESVSTLHGRVIKTGLHHWSKWSRGYAIKIIGDNYNIEQQVIEILNLCENSKEFIKEILRSGGHADVQVRVGGQRNIGDTFSASTLTRLGNLGLSLSIEVFP